MTERTTHVVIRKIASSRCPRVPAAPRQSDQEANDPTRSLPVDYEMEGHLLAPLAVGGTIRLQRIRRNQVQAAGQFESSGIVAIREPFVETRNSIYLVEVQPTRGRGAAA